MKAKKRKSVTTPKRTLDKKMSVNFESIKFVIKTIHLAIEVIRALAS